MADGIVVLRLTPVPTSAAAKLPFGNGCRSPPGYEAWVVPTAPGIRECMGVAGPLNPGDWANPKADALFGAAIDRLRELGLSTPPALIGMVWYHAEIDTWASGLFYFNPADDPPAPTGAEDWLYAPATAHADTMRLVGRIASWAKRFTPLLQKGIAGTLDADASNPATPDDPG